MHKVWLWLRWICHYSFLKPPKEMIFTTNGENELPLAQSVPDLLLQRSL